MNSRMAVITFMDNGGDGAHPDQGLPGGPPVYPSHGLPGGLPPGAVQLPVFPFDPTMPDQGLPTPTPPVTPGQPLPVPPVRPSHPIAPGGRFVVKWFACHGLILVPDNTLPPAPAPK